MGMQGCFGSGGGETKPKSGGQQNWMNELLGIYGPQAGQGVNVYQGDRVAPFTGAQQGGFDALSGFVDFFSGDNNIPLYEETGKALSDALGGRGGAKRYTPESTEAYFSRAVEDPASRYYEKYAAPAAKEAFAGPGYWSGARANRQAQAGEDLANWLGTKRAGVERDVEAANIGIDEARAIRSLGAVGPSLAYGGMPTNEALKRLQGLGGTMGIAGGEQRQAQQQLYADMTKWAEENQISSPEVMQMMLALLGMNFGSTFNIGPGLGTGMVGSAGGAFGEKGGNAAAGWVGF